MQRVFQSMGWVVLTLGMAFSAFAGSNDIRKQTELSLLVTGHVVIEPDGSVSGLNIDQEEKIPPAVRGLIERARPVWRFEPVRVDGAAARARARMSLRVVAKKLDSGDYEIRLRGAYFGSDALDGQERIDQMGTATLRGRKLSSPRYPEGAQLLGAKGTVYVIIKVGPDGTVQESFAEQVNLQIVGRSEGEMKYMRDQFTRSALFAAKYWTFEVPTTGELADDGVWYARVPVSYLMPGDKPAVYGQWEAYIPGPKQKAPWADERDHVDPDAMLAGGIYLAGQGLRLLTPLEPG